METVYFQTRRFMMRRDNVIDFQAYKDKLAELAAEEETAPPPETAPAEKRAWGWADLAELAATVGVAAAALSATLAFLGM